MAVVKIDGVTVVNDNRDASFRDVTSSGAVNAGSLVVNGNTAMVNLTINGVATAATPSIGTNTSQVATTAFVQAAVATAAQTASPAFSGTPTAPTPSVNSSNTQIATTAFVHALTDVLAPRESPILTGTPTTTTPAQGASNTQIANTSFVQTTVSANAPTKSGGGAYGTWGINISGNAASASATDWSGVANKPTSLAGYLNADAVDALPISRLGSGFYQNAAPTPANGWPETGSWWHLLSNTHGNTANYYAQQFASDFYSNKLYYRSTNNSGATPWARVVLGDSGTYSVNISGTAAALGGVPAAQYALKDSPVFTGAPTANTAPPGSNTFQLATTAFVQTAIGGNMPGRASNISSFPLDQSVAVRSAPTLLGTNISGTAGSLNIGGNAASVTNGVYNNGGTYNINISGNAASVTNGVTNNGGTYGINITGNAATVTNGVTNNGGTYGINITGNAATVTNGVTNNGGTYGINITGNAATVTNGVYNNSGTYSINISGNAATVTNGVYNNGNTYGINISGNAQNITGVIGTANLPNSGATAGSYGSAIQIPVVTVDAKGRVTSITSVTGGFTGTYSGDASFNGVIVGRGSGNKERNTAVGATALWNNTSGESNAAVGYWALINNTSGANNTAVGDTALGNNTTGYSNTAVGQSAMNANVSGYSNAALGWRALLGNKTGAWNVAVGSRALEVNENGTANVALGGGALMKLTSSSYNTAVGNSALGENVSGQWNTAVGANSLGVLKTGESNTVIGVNSGKSITTGSKNVIIGSNDGATIATSNNNIILSDGDGNIRAKCNSTGAWDFGANSNFVQVNPAVPKACDLRIAGSDAQMYSGSKWVTFAAGINSFTYTQTSSANNPDFRALAIQAGWDQVAKLNIVIPSSVVIGSTSSTIPAVTIAGSFPGGVEIVNNGKIIGAGGAGGNGGLVTYDASWNITSLVPPTAGAAGGVAIHTTADCIVSNFGLIAGGGGGGGGGSGVSYGESTNDDGGGGGGGAGSVAGIGGTKGLFTWVGTSYTRSIVATNGANGSLSPSPGGTGGAGGVGSRVNTGGFWFNGGNGGNGGALGQSGVQGDRGNGYAPGQTLLYGATMPGGAAGSAISNMSNVTLRVRGTILGAILGNESPLYTGTEWVTLISKYNAFVYTQTSSINNANFRSLAITAGWDQVKNLSIVIPAGVVIGSANTTTPAATVAGDFPNGVALINNGSIVGAGGAGGNSTNKIFDEATGGEKFPPATAGNGGPALSVSVPCALTNNGIIGGGGGGGEEGVGRFVHGAGWLLGDTTTGNGGGGGGAGSVPGPGGNGFQNGTAGSLNPAPTGSGGAGGGGSAAVAAVPATPNDKLSGSPAIDAGVTGNPGGKLGAPGVSANGRAGAAGAAITGFSNVTVVLRGTIYGATV